MHEAIYFVPDGPLREEFRENWSCWSLATKHEIDDAIKRLMEAKQNGSATELMLRLDRDANRFWRFSLMFAQK